MGAARKIGSGSLVGFPLLLSPPAAAERRFVAVAVTAAELLRPGSDLAGRLADARTVDLLLACEEGREGTAVVRPLNGADLGAWEAVDLDLDDGCADEDAAREVRQAAAGLGLADLHLHRLGLRAPLGPAAEMDLVAALSELVGFDPEPGVYLVAPAPAPADPSRTVISRAVERIARVYGLPLLRYRGLELSIVPDL